MSGLPPELVAGLRARAASENPIDLFPGRPDPIPLAPLSTAELADAEARLGAPLGPCARDLWGRVGNGGFGPGYGISGLVGGHDADSDGDAVTFYETLLEPDPSDDRWRWPDTMLPFCSWGCAIHSVVDLGTTAEHVFRFDPNVVADDWRAAWFDEGLDLAGWLQAWLAGDDLWLPPTLAPIDDIFELGRTR